MKEKPAPAHGKKWRIWVAAGTVVALLAGIVSCNVITNADTGTIASIFDGETLVVSIQGSDRKVRLLNVKSAQYSECLAPQAKSFLTDTIPVGAKVKLKFDVARKKGPDNLVAAVFTESGTLVNSEIVRAGLGTTRQEGTEQAYLEPMLAAENDAENASRGLYGTEVACTIPAQIEDSSRALVQLVDAPASTTSAAAAETISTATVAVAKAQTLETVLTATNKAQNTLLWSAYTPSKLAGHLATLKTDIYRAQTKVRAMQVEKSVLAAAEAKAVAAKKAAAAKAAAEKVAAENARKAAAEAASQAKAQAAAEAAAATAEAERIRNLPPVYVPPVYQPPVQNSGGGDGYTGPRCYAPGGKSYRPC